MVRLNILLVFHKVKVSFIYIDAPNCLWDFDLCGSIIHTLMAYMKFLFVRPDVCRRLPSDSILR